MAINYSSVYTPFMRAVVGQHNYLRKKSQDLKRKIKNQRQIRSMADFFTYTYELTHVLTRNFTIIKVNKIILTKHFIEIRSI